MRVQPPLMLNRRRDIMKLATGLLTVALALPALAQPSLVEQGRTAMSRGETDRAVELLEKAVKATPNNADAHYLLGSAYGRKAQKASIFSQMGLAGKAKDHLIKAVELDPNHLDARFGLMEYYAMAPGIVGGSKDKAQQQAAEIKKRDSIIGHRAYAQLFLHDKNNDAARNEYVAAVRENPNSPKAHYGLGTFYLSVDKNNKGATDEFEASIKIDPNYMPGWFQVGHMAALTGAGMPRGEEALRKYLAYAPRVDEPPHARAHYWLGQIFEKQGKRAEAKASYQTSLRLNPAQKDVSEALKRVS